MPAATRPSISTAEIVVSPASDADFPAAVRIVSLTGSLHLRLDKAFTDGSDAAESTRLYFSARTSER